MPPKTIVFALALIAVGVVAYAITLGHSAGHPTALIPAAEGVLLLICGLLALKPAMLKHAMHAAAVVGLLGLLAAAGRLISALVRGVVPDALALTSLLLMIALSAGFVLACVLHFRATRKARESAVA